MFQGDSSNVEAPQLELKDKLLRDICCPFNQQLMKSSLKEINIYVKQTNDVNSKTEVTSKPLHYDKTKKSKQTDHFLSCENGSIDINSPQNKNKTKHESHFE